MKFPTGNTMIQILKNEYQLLVAISVPPSVIVRSSRRKKAYGDVSKSMKSCF